MGVVLRQCRKCDKTKPLELFEVQKLCRFGRSHRCKECAAAYESEYKKRDRGRINARDRVYLSQNRDKSRGKVNKYAATHRGRLKLHRSTPEGRYAACKKQAKARKLEFDISKEEFVSFWDGVCIYCGDPTDGTRLDRIDSTKGYIIDNIATCCTTCNIMKSVLSQEEFHKHIKKIYLKNLVDEFDNVITVQKISGVSTI